MPIIRNLRKDFDEGRMDKLRSLTYEERGTKAPYVVKSEEITSSKSSIVQQAGLQLSKRLDDTSRIAQMLIDKPGLKHLANEALLKQGEISDKLERNKKYQEGSKVGNFLRRAGGTIKHVAQVAMSTVAQVPVNGTGTHFLRAFKTDTYLQDGESNSALASLLGAGGLEGSKYALQGAAIPAQGVITDSKLPIRNTTASPEDLGKYHIGIEGNLSSVTDISRYTNVVPFYNKTESTVYGAQNGYIIPGVDSTFNNTTVLPNNIGIPSEYADGAIVDEFEPLTVNPSLIRNTYSPNSSTEYTGNTTEDNVTRIKVGSSISKPQDLSRNTTPQPFSIGIDKKDIVGDVTENTITSTYRPDGTYSETDTVSNISNAISGNPINNPRGTGEFDSTFAIQTTPTPGQFGISNKGIEGNITEITPKLSNTYTNDKPQYTATLENINNIQTQGNGNSSAGIAGGKRLNILKDTVVNTSRTNIGVTGEYNGTTKSINVNTNGGIQDFRNPNSENAFNKEINNTYFLDYGSTTINKEQRVGLGNQGKRDRIRTSYTVNDIDTVDKVNKLDVSDKPLDAITDSRDLIQLEFQIITPEQTHWLAFRAFLDTFDDSFNASWNTTKYLGRADSFYTYSGFERSINIGFKIAAASREEMEPLYRKAATLASVTAPTYGSSGQFMRGSIAKVTVGDYIYEQPGIIESVQYTWQKDYPWEISFENPEGEGGKDQILPHVLDVSLSFKVIHDFLPETGINPFITNHTPITDNKLTYIKLKS